MQLLYYIVLIEPSCGLVKHKPSVASRKKNEQCPEAIQLNLYHDQFSEMNLEWF